jgi:hypothetical protein
MYDQVASYYQEYFTLTREIAAWEYYSGPLCNLGHIAVAQGDLPRAVDFFRQSIDSDQSGEDIPWNLWGLASVAAAGGRTRQAARLYGVVDALLESGGAQIVYREDQEDYAREVAVVRERLGEAEFAAAWAEGAAMSVEEAVAYALAEQEM